MKAMLIVAALFFTLMVSSASACDPRLPFCGNGIWLQESKPDKENSIDNPNIFSPEFHWFVVPPKLMNHPNVLLLESMGRKLVIGFGKTTAKNYTTQLAKYFPRFVAVVWDYEIGADQETARYDLAFGKYWAHYYGLPFGVWTLQDTDVSLLYNGISFQEAYLLMDFIMPHLYFCWWYDKGGWATRWFWDYAQQTTPLIPIIPVATLSCTSLNAETNKQLSGTELLAHYSDLTPRPTAFCWWNVGKLDEDRLGAIHYIGDSMNYR